MICAICNKKQSGWIEDFPLSVKMSEHRICANCKERLDILSDSKNFIKETETITESIGHISSCLENITSTQVIIYLRDILSNAKKRIELIRKKEEEIALEAQKKAELERLFNQKLEELMLTTGNSFEGYRTKKYIDIIYEETIFKNSFWNNIGAGLEDLGNCLSFKEKELTGASDLISNAREYAMKKFKEKAVRLDANAIIGIDFENTFGSDVVRVAISGTAVQIEKLDD